MKYIEIKKTNNKIVNNVFIPRETKEVNLPAYCHTDTLIESGKDAVLFNLVLEYIEMANEAIYLQSFLIQDSQIIDALVDAVERDVKVFVTDSEAKLQEQTEEEESFIITEYKAMLEHKFKNKITHRLADNLHAKFIVTDPHISPKGIIFTGNFNKKPFFENPEIGIILNPSQVKILYKLFVYHFWEHCTHEQTVSKSFINVKPLNKFEAFKTAPVIVTSPNSELSNLKQELIQAVNIAQESITFSTFGFDINHELSQAILTKLKTGIEVTLYCRPREKAIIGHIEQLRANGADVICHELIHAKSLIIDNETAYVFTANFEKHGMDSGFEVGLKLNKKQTEELLCIHQRWTNSFPYMYEQKQAIANIKTSSFYRFNKIGHLEKVEITSSKEITLNANNISELIKQLNSPIRDNYTQNETHTIELKPIEKTVKYNIKTSISEGVDIISIALRKKKTEEALLINTRLFNFQQKDLDTLKKQQENTKVFSL